MTRVASVAVDVNYILKCGQQVTPTDGSVPRRAYLEFARQQRISTGVQCLVEDVLPADDHSVSCSREAG